MAKRETWLQVRMSKKEKNFIRLLANTYSKGDLSAWVRHAVREAPRVMLNKKPR